MTSIASPDGREQVEPLMATIYARRSIRRYTDERVPREVVTALLDAAIRAPSAHNRQPWRFAVIEDDAMKRTLAAAMGERLRVDLARDGVPKRSLMLTPAGRMPA
ncbi:MAG: nitroreductase family protein [Chloroflexi bacterium]|nr:nitroreductase family protein [Chloroflexota bacterium]